jgi:hypothetical protein
VTPLLHTHTHTHDHFIRFNCFWHSTAQSESKSDLLYDWRFTVYPFALARIPWDPRPVFLVSNWTLAVIVLMLYSLWWEDSVCRLQTLLFFASAVILRFESHGNNYQILLSRESTAILGWSYYNVRWLDTHRIDIILPNNLFHCCARIHWHGYRYQEMTLFFGHHVTVLHWSTASAVDATSFITLRLTSQLTGGFVTSVLCMGTFTVNLDQIQNLITLLFTIFPCYVWTYWYLFSLRLQNSYAMLTCDFHSLDVSGW